MAPTLVWLRDDLRLADNPALSAAAQSGDVVVCYILDEESPGIRPLGGASRWWLHHSLLALSGSLAELGVPLILRRGAAAAVIPRLIEETGAGAVVWNRRYGLAERSADAAIKTWCGEHAVTATSFQANLLFEPWAVTTGSGGPYRVFTPFWRACMDGHPPRQPLGAPSSLRCGNPPMSNELDYWALLPTRPNWAQGLRETWTPGEDGAHRRLAEFLDDHVSGYQKNRDLPASEGTSRLSPHLRFGEISPFDVWHAAQERKDASVGEDIRVFGSELGWREFCWQLLYFNPELATKNYRPEFDAFAWESSTRSELQAWQEGRTGYPLVDAGMRQMWETGWMHNRIRMVTGSFLIKNLLIDWRVGEQWFWDCLVDADTASNAANWQWVAGSGADASPYFRVFNPVTQSRKFDPEGKYLLRFVPELADAENIHEPWKGRAEGYPAPVVDLRESRERALAAYQALRKP
ncbi:deoxyribodipyrimidine photo-lyase [Arthrobacter sp. Br18]|uniref:cryptochrome/photolyase family protein n=1 Tax=Arthrobacter sp. Br18 TaxID=1312954 RepID=UPI000479758C|nr:deoxyribodipyrimidine photo-lyase [Arthrobacter sp. Br18]